MDMTQEERQAVENAALALQLTDMLLSPVATRRPPTDVDTPPDAGNPIAAANFFIGMALFELGRALNDEPSFPTWYLSGLLQSIAEGQPVWTDLENEDNAESRENNVQASHQRTGRKLWADNDTSTGLVQMALDADGKELHLSARNKGGSEGDWWELRLQTNEYLNAAAGYRKRLIAMGPDLQKLYRWLCEDFDPAAISDTPTILRD